MSEEFKYLVFNSYKALNKSIYSIKNEPLINKLYSNYDHQDLKEISQKITRSNSHF